MRRLGTMKTHFLALLASCLFISATAATDDSGCYNDTEPPIAVCDEHTVIALGADGKATLYATTLDDGSYDNCEIKSFKVARMHPGWCPPGVIDDTQFRSYTQFCCEDIGHPILVILRVTDKAGNFNECMVEVTVQDKLPPSIHCPYDKTIDCDYWYPEGELHDPYSPIFGAASAYDNCGLEGIWVDVVGGTTCGQGHIKRVFTAVDWGGKTAKCTQKIWIIDPDPFTKYDITWPKDYEASGCDYVSTNPDHLPYGFDRPRWYDDECSMIAAAYDDLEFEFVEGVCKKILRTWTVIDWCQFDPYNPYKGIWTHVQVIKLKDNYKPQFEACHDITVHGLEPDCKGRVIHDPQVWDICTPKDKLHYEYKVDFFKNGHIDIRRENKHVLDEIMPIGTHKVLWFVDDGCGNLATCSYHVTVKDGKAPTPICYAQLSTVVMPVGGMVTLWAKDFDASSFDNCTPPNKLKFSFSPNVNEGSRQFNCDDVGNNNLQIYVTDQTGNQAYCNVWITIGDNEAACMTDSLSGLVSTLSGSAVSGATVELYKLMDDQSMEMDRTDETALDGSYLTGFGTTNFDRMIGVQKESDPLEGISGIDLIMIQQHITGVNPITDPAMLYAADVDGSGHVGVSDLLMLRDAFLSNGRTLNGAPLDWTFFPADCEWGEGSFAPDCNLMVEVDKDNPTKDPINFIGVKKGDVNGDMMTELTGHAQGLDVKLAVQQRDVTTRIYFLPTREVELSGLQLSLTSALFKGSGIDILSEGLELRGGSYMIDRVSGKLNVLWLAGNTKVVGENEALFAIDLPKTTYDRLRASLNFKGDFRDLAFDPGMAASKVRMSWRGEAVDLQSFDREGQDLSGIDLSVEEENSVRVTEGISAEIVPNPVTTQAVAFYESNVDGEILFEVYSSDLRQVISRDVSVVRGTNSIVFDTGNLTGPGIYYYRITSGANMLSGKFISLN